MRIRSIAAALSTAALLGAAAVAPATAVVAATRSGLSIPAGAGSIWIWKPPSTGSAQANSTGAPLRSASFGIRLKVSAARPKNGANSPPPNFGCWSGVMPTISPAFSARHSGRMALVSAGTRRTLAPPRARRRKTSPAAFSGTR